MRLIDADTLDFSGEIVTSDVFGMGVQEGLHRASISVAKAPTVDAVPVVRARWMRTYITDTDPWYCSNCLNTVTVTGYKRCPSCGATMDLGAKETTADEDSNSSDKNK